MNSPDKLLFVATWPIVSSWPLHGYDEVRRVQPLDLRGLDFISLAVLWSQLSSMPWLTLSDRIAQEVWPHEDKSPWLNALAPEFTAAVAKTSVDSSLAQTWHRSLLGHSGHLSEDDLLTLLVGIASLASKAMSVGGALFVWDNERLSP